MKVVDVNILPLDQKHYSTDIGLTVEVDGNNYTLVISVAGYAPNASSREKAKGWIPDWGMDHVESETHLMIAHKIATTLAELKGDK